MKVSSVSANYQPYNVSNNVKKYSTNSINQHEQINEISNLSYGTALVNFNGIKNTYDISDKISAAYAKLKKDDVLLVGKDLASAKKAIIDNAKSFDALIKNIFFVAAPTLNGALAIKRNDSGFDELYNLSSKPLFIQRNDTETFNKKENDENDYSYGNRVSSFYVNQYERPATLLDFDTINFMGGENIVLDKEAEVVNDVFLNGDISIIDMPEISEINAKNLQNAISVEKEVGASKNIKLSDVGGQDEAVAQLKQKVLFPIKYPNFFDNNLKGFNSALLVGPPGTGKTLAAMALANEAGIPFYNMNGQLLEGKFVGESAHNIDEYYELAKHNQPCILFFDEADGIFSKRTGEHKYADDSVNMHLDKISELEKEGAKVFLLAATNHPELMDEGILRNGRFGTKIEFKAPDTVEKCKAIFDIHAKNVNIENVDKNMLAKKMLDAKFNGADIAALVTEAKYAAIARQGIFEQMETETFKDLPDFKLVVTNKDFEKSLEKLNENKKTIASYSKTGNIEDSQRVIGFQA